MSTADGFRPGELPAARDEDNPPPATAGSAPSVRSAAVLSACGRYRYRLERWWDNGYPLHVVMLNPSTADAALDDPTIRRCVRFAKRDGYAGLVVLNLYAWRATRPLDMFAAPDPVGPDNDHHLELARAAVNGSPAGAYMLAAWGAHARPDRVAVVRRLLASVDLRCLGTTKEGHPRHPLYVRGTAPARPWPVSS
jgi:hypothetical protein